MWDFLSREETVKVLGAARTEEERSILLFALHTGARACRRAGLREIRWHDLRHSFASQLAAAGVPLRQVQEWLGHSTINMTVRYAHLAPGSGASLILALEPSAVATTWQQEGA
jgi:site-specific recombinase XerD